VPTKVLMECRSSIDRGSIEGVDQHLTADTFSTHDPGCVGRQVKGLAIYKLQVDKGKLTTIV